MSALAVGVSMTAGRADGVGDVIWEVDLGAPPTRTPALVEDVLYLPLTNGVFRVLDAHTGALCWERNLGAAAFGDLPLVAPGGVVVVSLWRTNAWSHTLLALEAGNGTTLWSRDVPGDLVPPVLIPPQAGLPDGGVLGGSQGFSAFDLLTGKPRWSVPMTNNEAGLRAVVAGPDGRVVAQITERAWQEDPISPWPFNGYSYLSQTWLYLDATSGREMSRYGGGAETIDAVAYLADGQVLRLNQNFYASFIDSFDRREWYFNRPGVLFGPGWYVEAGLGGGLAADVDGDVFTTGAYQKFYEEVVSDPYSTFRYVANREGCWVQRVDFASGERRWAIDLPAGWLTAPAIAADGLVWYATHQGMLIARDTDSGTVRHEIHLPAAPATAPLLTDGGAILIGCVNGKFLALRGTSGAPCSSWPQANGTGRNGAALTWMGKPGFLGEPAKRVLAVGDALRFLPHAEGERPMTWQWYRDDTMLPAGTNQLLRLTAGLGDAGRYTVVVSNSLGTATGHIANVDVGYRLTTNVTGLGDVVMTPPGPVFTAGTRVEVRAVPHVGSRFLGWAGGLTNPVQTLTMASNHAVHAVFAGGKGGELRWQLAASGAVRFAPAVQEYLAYFVTDAKQCHALSTVDGSQHWAADLGGLPAAAPVLADDGTLLIALGNGRVKALRTTDGSTRWITQVSSYAIEHLATDAEGRVFAAPWQEEVIALELNSGTVLWRRSMPAGWIMDLAVGNGYALFVGTNKPRRLDRRDGRLDWSVTWEANSETGFALGSGGVLFLADSQNDALCVSQATGQVHWRTRLPKAVGYSSSPIITDDGGVVWNLASKDYALLDQSTGALRKLGSLTRYDTKLGSTPLFAGAGGQAVLGIGYSLAGGQLLVQTANWEVVHQSTSQPVIGPDGGVYYGSGRVSGQVNYFRCVESGTLPANSPWPGPGGDARNRARIADAFAQPQLHAAFAAGQLELELDGLPAGVWSLESASRLEAEVWQEVQAITAGQERINLPLGEGARFFRLRRK